MYSPLFWISATLIVVAAFMDGKTAGRCKILGWIDSAISLLLLLDGLFFSNGHWWAYVVGSLIFLVCALAWFNRARCKGKAEKIDASGHFDR